MSEGGYISPHLPVDLHNVQLDLVFANPIVYLWTLTALCQTTHDTSQEAASPSKQTIVKRMTVADIRNIIDICSLCRAHHSSYR